MERLMFQIERSETAGQYNERVDRDGEWTKENAQSNCKIKTSFSSEADPAHESHIRNVIDDA